MAHSWVSGHRHRREIALWRQQSDGDALASASPPSASAKAPPLEVERAGDVEQPVVVVVTVPGFAGASAVAWSGSAAAGGPAFEAGAAMQTFFAVSSAVQTSVAEHPVPSSRNRTGVDLNGVSRRRSRRYATKSVATAGFGGGFHRSGRRSRMPSSAVLSMRSSTSAR